MSIRETSEAPRQTSGELSRTESLRESVGASSAAAVVSRSLGLVRGIALAWLIPADQFGRLALALVTINVLLPLFSLGLPEVALRFASRFESAGNLRNLAGRILRFLIWPVALLAAVYVFASDAADPYLFSVGSASATTSDGGNSPVSGLSHVVALCVLSLVFFHVRVGWLQGLRRFRRAAVMELLAAGGFTIGSIGAAFLGHTTAPAMLWVYFLSNVLSLIGEGFSLRERGNPQPPTVARINESALLPYGIWIAATQVLWQAMSYFPMWRLQHVSGDESAGALHAVRLVTQLVHIVAAVLTSVVASHVAASWERDRMEGAQRLNRLTRISLLGLLMATAVLSLFKPLAVRTFPATLSAGSAAYDATLAFYAWTGGVVLVSIRLNLLERTKPLFFAWLWGDLLVLAGLYCVLAPRSNSLLIEPSYALCIVAFSAFFGAGLSLLVVVLLAWRAGLPVDRAGLTLLAAMGFVSLGWLASLAVLIVITFGVVRSKWILEGIDRKAFRRFRLPRFDR